MAQRIPKGLEKQDGVQLARSNTPLPATKLVACRYTASASASPMDPAPQELVLLTAVAVRQGSSAAGVLDWQCQGHTPTPSQGSANFCWEAPDSKYVNILGTAGHIVSIKTTQLHHCSKKAAMDNM